MIWDNLEFNGLPKHAILLSNFNSDVTSLTVQIYSLHSAIFSSKALPLGYCLLLIIVVFENVEIETLPGNSNFF